ncbi:MAG: xanthine dehydrogenase family protein molybdopterin-binding subunit [Nitriliruptorales bacterium]|nr:xanthine dehydrogenase family protein molybdopterin-binding subunit [Nitriliruptorales bacterium]
MTTIDLPRDGAIGTAKRRKEDPRLLTGQTNWTDNIQLPGTLHAAIVRSPMAHARIGNVDLTGVRDRPGVVAAYTGRDLVGHWESGLPTVWEVTEDMVQPVHHAIAVDEVRHVGDPVAVVLARSRYEAADAVEHVVVDYEPLPAILDPEEALEDGATLAHTDLDSNRCFLFDLANGDLDEAFEGATHVVRRRFINQRLIPNAIEPRAVVAAPVAAAGEVTLYSSTQVPHVLRLFLAMVTGTPEHKIRVVAPDVGGGFGSKLNVYAEELICVAVAQRLGRPIKWTESRSEGYLGTIHGRDQIQDMSLALDDDGRIRAVRAELIADLGAYLQLVTPGTPILGAFMFGGIYKMDAYHFRCTGVFTNKTPTDAYRGAGRPEATFALERLIDEAAHELGIEPLEFRRRNWIGHEEFPYTTAAGLTYDSGNYEAATEKALALFDYEALREEQRERRESGDAVQLGIGISTYTEMCGLAPSRVLGSLNYGGPGWEHASVRMLPTGKVQVVTGTSPHGQGHETAWAQIASDALGVPYEDIEVLHGDTQIAPLGMDTYGSRSLAVGGVALWHACQKVIDRARPFAAHLLEVDPEDVEFKEGRFQVAGAPDQSTTIQDIALAAFAAHDYPEGVEPNLNSETTFDPENFSYPHGTHLCAVEVDTETGRVAIRRYVAVDDVGNVVNPQIVEGQVHGGLAQGIAQALYEEAVYDEHGNLQTGTMADYHVPAAPDLPPFVTDRTETPATTNPLGVKGVGEAGTIASPPAVVNAVVDAVRHLGVHDVRMPCSPRNVWTAIQQAGADEQGGAS